MENRTTKRILRGEEDGPDGHEEQVLHRQETRWVHTGGAEKHFLFI